jgi:hypothetical protein
VYEEVLATEEAGSAELQLLLSTEMMCDNDRGFVATLGIRDPNLVINRIVSRGFPYGSG